MDFIKKKHTFRGMDGYAGFRHGTEYELQYQHVDETVDYPAHVVVINPVSKLHDTYTPAEFAEAWGKK